MKRTFPGLTLLLCLLTGLPAPTQQPAAGKSSFSPQRAETSPQLAEDIEILRRILTGRLESLLAVFPTVHYEDAAPAASATSYLLRLQGVEAPVANLAFSPDGKTLSSIRLRNLVATALQPGTEGVYLPGYGVVYTLTLPANRFRDPHTEPAKLPAPPPSDWERTRMEVRGGQAAPREQPAEPRQPSLREVILKILAENGRHLQRLTDAEQITVVVTLRPTQSDHQQSSKPTGKEFVRRAFLDLAGREPTPRELELFGDDTSEARARLVDALLADNLGRDPVGRAWKDFFAKAASSNEHSLLGDLHMKQLRYAEAIKAYTAALKENPPAKEAAVIYRKLAQAQLAGGELKAAEAALTKAQQLQDEAAKAGSAGDPAPAGSPLPAKLIVSATKKLLDQVGSGKITLEEFKKLATVDYQTFTGKPKEAKQP